MKRPWMPLYIADYLKDTTHLGALESGAYLHLIMDYWQNGKLPADERQLARIAKLTEREWKKCRTILQAFFHDGWKHKRIDEELAHTEQVSSKRRGAANARHHPNDVQPECKDDANAHTLHTTQRKEDPADAGSSGKYAFESGVICLKQSDFDKWTQAFQHLNLRAELLSLTEWAGQQPKWFFAVSSALAKRDREVMATRGREISKPFKWNGIEGVI